MSKTRCTKVAYESKLAAHWAILTIWKGNAVRGEGIKKMPRKAYYCVHGEHWHLTSREDDE